MPACPQCNREYNVLAKECPSCKADLTLLVDHTKQLELGLEKADEWTRTGELGRATWAYLAVLEVDPNNPKARKQISRIATAVRQFDTSTSKQRWAFLGKPTGNSVLTWILLILLILLVPGAWGMGWYLGWTGWYISLPTPSTNQIPADPDNNSAM